VANHRRTTAAAVATILASLSLYPIFQGSAWFFGGAASVIVVALTGTLTRLRRLPIAVVLPCYFVVLLLWLNFAFSNKNSLWHLLPTIGSLAALFDNAGLGFNEASAYAPPVPGLRGMLLLAAAGIGIAAVGVDLIAVRLSNAALAGLPLLLLFTEPFTLSVSRGWVDTAVAFSCGVAGYLGLLSSEMRDKIKEWGDPDPLYVADPATLASAGRRVAFASVVIALCLPLLIPGLHATRLFSNGQVGIGGSASNGTSGNGSGGSGGSGGAGLASVSQTLTSELRDSTTVDELTYVSNESEPNYLQVYTYNVLTDSGWAAGPQQLVPAGRSLPPAPGLTAAAAGRTVTTNVNLADPSSYANNALPAPYPATAIQANGTVTADKSTLMLFDNSVSLNGLSYTVTSLDPQPQYQQLAAVAPPPASIAKSYEYVPPSYDSLKQLAQQETAGDTTELTKAVALQNWLADTTFKYSLKAPSVSNAAQLTQFLKDKTGYCQQFSFAMATLARLLGIPSRIVYGYTSGSPANQNPGSTLDSDYYIVTNHDAHAWPELYFQGYGWLRFEPTPSGTNGQGSAYAPIYSDKPTPGSQTGGNQATPTTAPTTGLAANPHLNQQSHSGAARPTKPTSINPWVIVGLVLAFLIVAGAGTPWFARRVVRQRRWQGRGTARAGMDRVRARDVAWAHAAWEELRDDLSDHGAPSLPSETPRAVAARAGTGLDLAESARAALGRIAMAEERARYAPTPSDGSGLHADSVTVRRAIAAAVPREIRWRALVFPSSVVTPVLRAVGSVTDLYRDWRRG
jgi:transglutaminase-like putative cysteine protease